MKIQNETMHVSAEDKHGNYGRETMSLPLKFKNDSQTLVIFTESIYTLYGTFVDWRKDDIKMAIYQPCRDLN